MHSLPLAGSVAWFEYANLPFSYTTSPLELEPSLYVYLSPTAHFSYTSERYFSMHECISYVLQNAPITPFLSVGSSCFFTCLSNAFVVLDETYQLDTSCQSSYFASTLSTSSGLFSSCSNTYSPSMLVLGQYINLCG